MTDYPVYLKILETGKLERLAEGVMQKLAACELCPHMCGTNRLRSELGYCKAGMDMEISGYGLHFGEEPPLVGHHGSGTIFFCHCNLGCVYCQNWDISHGSGEKISSTGLARIMLELQKQGCHNINLVTPTHYVPQIIVSIARAAEQGLRVPIVYNCGGYEAEETLKILEGIIDIYMPDFKYDNSETGLRLSQIPNYWEAAKSSLREMHRQVGDLIIDKEGIALHGLIIRHLVLPEKLAGTEEVMRFIAEEISPHSYINVMNQYYPAFKAGEYSPLDRTLTKAEYERAIRAAKSASTLFRFAD